jgi:hypothetical protein
MEKCEKGEIIASELKTFEGPGDHGTLNFEDNVHDLQALSEQNDASAPAAWR